MPESTEASRGVDRARSTLLRRIFGTVRLAYVPLLITYFCSTASTRGSV
jgi:hypothetical protein